MAEKPTGAGDEPLPFKKTVNTFDMIQLESSLIIVEDGVRTDTSDPDLSPREVRLQLERENDLLKQSIMARSAQIKDLKAQLELEEEKFHETIREKRSVYDQFEAINEKHYLEELEVDERMEKLNETILILKEEREAAQRIRRLVNKRAMMSNEITRLSIKRRRLRKKHNG